MTDLQDRPHYGIRTRQRLGDVLVAAGVVTGAQLEEALGSRLVHGSRVERLGETIVRLGFCSEVEVARALAHQMGLEFLDAPTIAAVEEVARCVPAALARRHRVVPLWREDDGVLVVACADPTNVVALDDVRVAAHARRLRTIVAAAEAIDATITRAHVGHGRAEQIVEELGAVEDEPEEHDAASEIAVSDAPIVRLGHEVIANAIVARASDVHIEPGPDGTVVRYRIDGVLHEAMALPRAVAAPLVSRLKLMGGLDIAERRVPQDGRCQFRGRQDDSVDLRLSTLPTLHGESLVMRLLRNESGHQSLETMGLTAQQAATLTGVIERPQGLLLVTGPTGSGKTTTLYALLGHLATTERKLITVEDPIEYQLAGVNQTQVHPRAGYTFARALRAMLRQDPDVVMVGEIRDPETAELALQASLTGHLVLATLHTNDSVGAVTRLRELGAPTYLIASSLSMVVAQRLARRVCEHCAAPQPPSAALLGRLGLPEGAARGTTFRVGHGCDACHHTGYVERGGLYEILPVDGHVRELIATGAAEPALLDAARTAGLRSLREDGLQKAVLGWTTLEEVARVTPRPERSEGACPACGQAVEPDFSVCPWCAADLRPLSCEGCGRHLDPAWRHCPGCSATTRAPVDETALPTVLIVDDDPSVRAALATVLVGDYQVITAADGQSALRAVHEALPAAVVLDMGLPDLDGYAVTREIRSRPAIRDVPILIITGHDDAEVHIASLKAGADDWLAKPFDPDVFIARLDRLVRRSATPPARPARSASVVHG